MHSSKAPLPTHNNSQIVLDFVCFYVYTILFILFLQHYSNRTSMLFEDLPALFGPPLPKDGLMVRSKYQRTSAYRDIGHSLNTLFLCEREFWWCPVQLMAAQLQTLLLHCHHFMMPIPLNSLFSSNAMIAILT